MNPTVNLKKVKVLNSTNVLANTSATSSIAVAYQGVVSFLKASAALFVSVVYAKIDAFSVQKSLNETVSQFRISWTAAANTEYAFFIQQDVPNNAAATGLSQQRVSASFTALPTNAQIGAALLAQVNAIAGNGRLQVLATYTASNAFIDIDGVAGFPLVQVLAGYNVTIASNMAAPAPSGTAALAIVDRVTAHATTATIIAGTSTVTVTTVAGSAHGLKPGDVVDITTTNTSSDFTMTDSRTGASGLASVTNAIIATVPTSNTFTLQGIVGNGGTNASNQASTIIRVKNKVRVTTASPHGLIAGDSVTVLLPTASNFDVTGSNVATVGSDFVITSRIESVPTTSSFWIFGAGNDSATNANTSVIVITQVAQESRGLGSQLTSNRYVDSFGTAPLAALDEIGAATLYTEVVINYSARKSVSGTSIPALGEQTENLVLLIDESATEYDQAMYRLDQLQNGRAWNSYLADPNLL